MGLYIKGAEMPDCCERCPCAYFTEGAFSDMCQATNGEDNDIEEYTDYGKRKGERPEWCPLVEVKTPHGRIIDGDALMAHMDALARPSTEDGGKSQWATGWAEAFIKAQPTILEAEE